MSSLSSSPPRFLVEHVREQTRAARNHARPHITLTWAQSLDAKLAGPGGARVLISGPETMQMTHWLRTMHDAILIGVHTVVMDDPRLKIQLVPQNDSGLLPPQPLVLDPALRLPIEARMLAEWRAHGHKPAEGPAIVRQPWVICGTDADDQRASALEAAGARIVRVDLDGDGRICPTDLPDILASLGLASVMIEGGSRVLSSFLHAGTRSDGSQLVDSIVVTVAPMFIGEGISIVPFGEDVGLPSLKTEHTETMGKDVVMVCTVTQ